MTIDDDNFRLSILKNYFNEQACSISKAVRLYNALLKMIESGYWLGGDKLPSEKYFSELLPVGLSTVQVALGRIASKGLITRKRKAGSFVEHQVIIPRNLAYFLFLNDDGKGYLPNYDVELSIKKTCEQGEWSQFLGNAFQYIKIERIVDIAGEFKIHNQIFLSESEFKALLNFPSDELLDVSFRILLNDKFDAPSLGASKEVCFTTLGVDIANKLNQETNCAALQYDICQNTRRNKPLFFMRFIIPQNERKLRINEMLFVDH